MGLFMYLGGRLQVSGVAAPSSVDLWRSSLLSDL